MSGAACMRSGSGVFNVVQVKYYWRAVRESSSCCITNTVQAWVRFLAIHSQRPARDSAIVMMNLAQLDSTIPSSYLRTHCFITH